MALETHMALAFKILSGRVTVNGFMLEYSAQGGWAKVDKGSLPEGVDPKGELIVLPEDATVKALSDGRFRVYPIVNGKPGKEYAEVQGSGEWVAWVTANEWTKETGENPPVSYVLPVRSCYDLFELQVNEGRIRIGRYS